MTQQNINLLNKLIKPTSTGALLSWRQFWLCNAGFLSLMILLYIIQQTQVYFLYLQNNSKIKEEKALQQEFVAIKDRFPNLFFSENVAKSINNLQNDLATGEKFLKEISSQVALSSYLNLLANTILPDIWLTEIKITEEGDQINLKGYSLSASAVQQFMQVLVSQELLANHILGVNGVDKTETTPEPTSQVVTSQAATSTEVKKTVQTTKPIEFDITMTKKQT